MEIPLVGGPYDGSYYDINIDSKGQPVLNVLNMPPRSSIYEGIISHLANAEPTVGSVIRYLLISSPVMELIHGRWQPSPTKWCWEYHYEG